MSQGWAGAAGEEHRVVFHGQSAEHTLTLLATIEAQLIKDFSEIPKQGLHGNLASK